MGMFSWFYSDINENIVWGEKVYLLIPNRKPIVGTYDGYGRVGDIDVYYVFALLNREDILNKKIPLDFDYKGTAEASYKDFSNLELDDDYFFKNYEKYQEDIRILGINYYFSKYRVKFPIKIASKEINYFSTPESEEDPEQGFYKYSKESKVYTCLYCGKEYDETEGFDDCYCSYACYTSDLEE